MWIPAFLHSTFNFIAINWAQGTRSSDFCLCVKVLFEINSRKLKSKWDNAACNAMDICCCTASASFHKYYNSTGSKGEEKYTWWNGARGSHWRRCGSLYWIKKHTDSLADICWRHFQYSVAYHNKCTCSMYIYIF